MRARDIGVLCRPIEEYDARRAFAGPPPRWVAFTSTFVHLAYSPLACPGLDDMGHCSVWRLLAPPMPARAMISPGVHDEHAHLAQGAAPRGRADGCKGHLKSPRRQGYALSGHYARFSH